MGWVLARRYRVKRERGPSPAPSESPQIRPPWTLDDPLDQSQPMPVPSVLGVELLEEVEELGLVLRLDAHPLSRTKKTVSPSSSAPDSTMRIRLIAHELDGVVQQILEDLHQAWAVAVREDRSSVGLHPRHPLSDFACHQVQGLLRDALPEVLPPADRSSSRCVKGRSGSFQQLGHLVCRCRVCRGDSPPGPHPDFKVFLFQIAPGRC